MVVLGPLAEGFEKFDTGAVFAVVSLKVFDHPMTFVEKGIAVSGTQGK